MAVIAAVSPVLSSCDGEVTPELMMQAQRERSRVAPDEQPLEAEVRGDRDGKPDRQRHLEAEPDDRQPARIVVPHVHERHDPAGQHEPEALASELGQRAAADQPESSKP